MEGLGKEGKGVGKGKGNGRMGELDRKTGGGGELKQRRGGKRKGALSLAWSLLTKS